MTYYPARFDLSDYPDLTIYPGYAWAFNFSCDGSLNNLTLKIKQRQCLLRKDFASVGTNHTAVLNAEETEQLAAGEIDYAVVNSSTQSLVFGGTVRVMKRQWYHD